SVVEFPNRFVILTIFCCPDGAFSRFCIKFGTALRNRAWSFVVGQQQRLFYCWDELRQRNLMFRLEHTKQGNIDVRQVPPCVHSLVILLYVQLFSEYCQSILAILAELARLR